MSSAPFPLRKSAWMLFSMDQNSDGQNAKTFVGFERLTFGADFFLSSSLRIFKKKNTNRKLYFRGRDKMISRCDLALAQASGFKINRGLHPAWFWIRTVCLVLIDQAATKPWDLIHHCFQNTRTDSVVIRQRDIRPGPIEVIDNHSKKTD